VEARSATSTTTEAQSVRVNWALIALGALGLVYAALAVPVAAPGSAVVLATAERSPDWLLGPWRVFGASGADGPLAGPLFYVGLWLAMVSYVVVLAGSRSMGRNNVCQC